MERYVKLIGKASGILLFAALTACKTDKDNEFFSGEAETIRVYTGISANGSATATGENLKACLIFWRETAYKEILSGGWPTHEPYLTAHPEENIDYYRAKTGISYDTGRSYPTGGSHVHVTGFAPAGLTTPEGKYYQTLEIPEKMQNGKVDFLSGDGNSLRIGTADNPFTDPEYTPEQREERQLEFCHLTSKIKFTATRHENMANRIGVRRIVINLKGQSVPTTLEWKNLGNEGNVKELGGYFPTEKKELDIELKANPNDMVQLNPPQNVDSCYVLAANNEHIHSLANPSATQAGEIKLTMDITAELLPYKEGVGYDETQAVERTWSNEEVIIESTTGNELQMGCAYRVNIIFDIYDLRLQGMEVPWYDGGIHYVPITPEEDNESPETE